MRIYREQEGEDACWSLKSSMCSWFPVYWTMYFFLIIFFAKTFPDLRVVFASLCISYYRLKLFCCLKTTCKIRSKQNPFTFSFQVPKDYIPMHRKLSSNNFSAQVKHRGLRLGNSMNDHKSEKFRSDIHIRTLWHYLWHIYFEANKLDCIFTSWFFFFPFSSVNE